MYHSTHQAPRATYLVRVLHARGLYLVHVVRRPQGKPLEGAVVGQAFDDQLVREVVRDAQEELRHVPDWMVCIGCLDWGVVVVWWWAVNGCCFWLDLGFGLLVCEEMMETVPVPSAVPTVDTADT